ncbi:MAG: hypothetical protein FJX55_11275 [Alphaproteobacteria bacterium]|nr:hypothetical protein [Alphaproteobacteria bacterium]
MMHIHTVRRPDNGVLDIDYYRKRIVAERAEARRNSARRGAGLRFALVAAATIALTALGSATGGLA